MKYYIYLSPNGRVIGGLVKNGTPYYTGYKEVSKEEYYSYFKTPNENKIGKTEHEVEQGG